MSKINRHIGEIENQAHAIGHKDGMVTFDEMLSLSRYADAEIKRIQREDDDLECQTLKQRVAELEAENMQLKFQLWGRGIIDDPGPKDPDTVDMFS